MSLYDEVAGNNFKSWLLVAFFFAFVAVVAYVVALVFFGFAGIPILFLAGAVAVAASFFSYWYSDKIVLSLARARPADERKEAFLINTVEGIALAAGIPAPRVYVIEDNAINAMATGRDPRHAAIAVTTGAMQKLNRLELEGVIAHEMSHVKNYDVRLATIAAIMAGFVIILADFAFRMGAVSAGDRREGRGFPFALLIGFILMILAPLFAAIIQAAISRKRESLADASGVMLTRYPDGLIGALRKIERDTAPPMPASQAIAHLYFTNPFGGKMLRNWFSTHPPIEERIAALEKYALETHEERGKK